MSETTGQRLRRLRNRLDRSIEEVAKAVGLSFSTIAMYERGERTPPTDKLRIMADYYGVTVSYLLGESDNNSEKTPLHAIPLLGTIRAGMPMLAYENWIGEVYTTAAGADFAVVVRGDSMVDAGIFEGDYAICKSVEDLSEVKPGQVVVAIVNGGEATLKRLMREDGAWFLRAENASKRYPDIPCDETARLQGVVLKVEREIDSTPQKGSTQSKQDSFQDSFQDSLQEALETGDWKRIALSIADSQRDFAAAARLAQENISRAMDRSGDDASARGETRRGGAPGRKEATQEQAASTG